MNLLSVLGWVQGIGGILMAISYLPNIHNLYKVKTAENHSLSFWVILDLALLCFTIGGAIIWKLDGTASVFLPQLVNLSMGLIILGQLLYYGRKDKLKNDVDSNEDK